MPLFMCSKCKCIENTALSRFWFRGQFGNPDTPPLCSECDPAISTWHGRFPKRSAEGMLAESVAPDALLWSAESTYAPHIKRVGKVVNGEVVPL